MAYVTVPKDLTKVKSKVALNLTKRQLVCFSMAAVVGVPLFFLIKGSVPQTAATFLMVLAGELLTPEQKEMFDIYMETKGNKPDVFGDDYATGTPGGGEYTDYEIPPEALSDERFAAMIAEAEKYLGYPYVWGGSSPSTSFDCSGFVCWVINHSGVGNVGRTTAQGIFNYTTPIAPSEAKPGDIIFFTGTYDSGSAVSHVGIYVGNGMMIHCGNPISYASVNTPYWQSHFYAYGRLP